MSAWTTMNDNKIVTYEDLANAISSGDLYQKSSFTSSKRAVRKLGLSDIIHIDTSNSFYTSRSNNQLLPKKAIVGIPLFYNLNLTSSASPSTVTAGNNVVYTINVRNDETFATSTNVVLAISFASNTSFVSYTITSGVSSTYSSGTLTITSAIASGATVVITITCSTTRPLTDGAGTLAIPLTATYSPTNSTTATPYLQYPTFTLEKVARQNDGTTNIPAGTNLAYNTTFIYLLRVRNTTSNLYSSDTVLTDVLPSNLAFDSFYTPLPSGWTSNYNSTTRTVTFSKSGVLHDSIFNTFISLGIRVVASTENVSLSNNFTASGVGINSKTSDNFNLTVGYNTSPVLTSQGYSTCSSCFTYTVFRDTNVNSATYNQYYVNGSSVGNTAPSNGACDYSSQYENTGQIYCSGCSSYFVYAHNYSAKPCYTGDPYQVNGVGYSYNPATGACNTSPDYGSASIGIMCLDCEEYTVHQNINGCYTGTLQYFSNGNYYESNPVTGACVSTPNYQMYIGQTCIDCITYSVYKNVSTCFFGNQWSVNGVTYATQPTLGACDYTPNIQSQGYSTCSGCQTYTVFRDVATNCSSTKNHYFVNGVDVGLSAPSNGSCVTSPNLEFQGYNTCISCVPYPVYKDTRECSSTYNHYFANNTDLGTAAPSSADCACCEEISISNNSGSEAYIEWLPCSAGSNTSYWLQDGETIYFCRNTNASFNTGGLGYSVGGACSYNGYTIFTT